MSTTAMDSLFIFVKTSSCVKVFEVLFRGHVSCEKMSRDGVVMDSTLFKTLVCFTFVDLQNFFRSEILIALVALSTKDVK